MRVHLAIIFSLICGPVMAEGSGDIQFSTTVPAGAQPISVGRPHVCNAYYPTAALKAYAQGTAQLEFTVTSSGDVKDLKLAKSSGNKDLDDASVNCASRWHYKPATKDGVPMEVPWKANVAWIIHPPPEMEAAMSCLFYRNDNTPPPADLGHTVLGFRVLQDGSVVSATVRQSSGHSDWDDLGITCVKGRRFDMAMFTLPYDGLPGHWDINWLGVINLAAGHTPLPPPVASSPPAASPPPK